MDAGPAPAIMDALYPRLLDSVMDRRSARSWRQLKDARGRRHASTGLAASPAAGINYIDKDLRTLLGTKFKDPFRTSFCGSGSLAACRTAVWAALDAAGTTLAARQGPDPPGLWKSDANAERIKFAPGLLHDHDPLHEPPERHPAGDLVHRAPLEAQLTGFFPTRLRRAISVRRRRRIGW